VEFKFMKIEKRLDGIEQKVDGILRLLQKEQKATNIVKKVSEVDTMAVKLYARTLEGLSNPIRIAILSSLAKNGAYYHELAKLTGLSPAPLSFHLKSLKSSGLVYQDARRRKYLVTGLGVKLLALIKQMADALCKLETIDLDRYCFLCSRAKMKVDMFPTHFRIWCPKCGGEHGSKWSFDLLNLFGEEWRRHGLEKLLEAGWKETFKLMKKAVQSDKCINCNAQIKYVFHGDRLEGECLLCGEHYSMRINDLTPDRLFPLWEKHKKIQQRTEGPLEKDGVPCWKITVTNERNEIIAVQYVKVGTGEEVSWEEYVDSQTTASSPSRRTR
jgi:DNA-binding transcriptional ArsR family regulator